MKTRPICKIKQPGLPAKHRKILEEEFSKKFILTEAQLAEMMAQMLGPIKREPRIKGRINGMKPF